MPCEQSLKSRVPRERVSDGAKGVVSGPPLNFRGHSIEGEHFRPTLSRILGNWLLASLGTRLQPPQTDKSQLPLTAQPFAAARFTLAGLAGVAFAGSPLAALTTSPPPSSAICASSRCVSTERGYSASMSSFDAYSSRCLISSQDLPGLPP